MAPGQPSHGDYDEDVENLQQSGNLGDNEETNSASNMSPDLEEVWQYRRQQIRVRDRVINRSDGAHDGTSEDGSATYSAFSSAESFEYHEHNIWNPMLTSL